MAKRARRNGERKGRRRAPPPPPRLARPEWRTLAIVIVVFLVIAVSAYALTSRQDDKDDDGNGNGNGNNVPPTALAPDFVIQTIDDEPITLDQFKGTVVVLDLMATWCDPCALQMSELNQVRASYSDTQVTILSIGVDTQETAQQLRDFRDQHYADWRFARDTDDVGTKYDAGSIPTLAIVAKDGTLVWRHSGVVSFEDLKGRIDPLL